MLENVTGPDVVFLGLYRKGSFLPLMIAPGAAEA